MKPKVYVIILNYNSWLDTIECVESVLKNDYSNFQVVVLDNNSSDNSLNYLKLWADGKLSPEHLGTKELNNLSVSSAIKKPLKYFYLTKKELQTLSDKEKKQIFSNLINFNKNQYYSLVFIQNEENKGFAAGNNVFLKFLLDFEKDAFVFLVNPDIVIEKDTISKLVHCAKKDEIVGLSIHDYANPEKEIIKAGFIRTEYGTVKPVDKFEDLNKLDFISGSALFCHISVFEKVGLLPEEYFLYWEEADWCTKAKRMGILLSYCKGSKVFDKGGCSVGGRNNRIAEYYYTYNLFTYYSKYFPDKKNKMYFFVLLRMVKKLLTGKVKVAVFIFKAFLDVLFSKKKKMFYSK